MNRVGQAGQGLPIQLDQQANADSAQRAKPKPRSHAPSKVCIHLLIMLFANMFTCCSFAVRFN